MVETFIINRYAYEIKKFFKWKVTDSIIFQHSQETKNFINYKNSGEEHRLCSQQGQQTCSSDEGAQKLQNWNCKLPPLSIHHPQINHDGTKGPQHPEINVILAT